MKWDEPKLFASDDGKRRAIARIGRGERFVCQINTEINFRDDSSRFTLDISRLLPGKGYRTKSLRRLCWGIASAKPRELKYPSQLLRDYCEEAVDALDRGEPLPPSPDPNAEPTLDQRVRAESSFLAGFFAANIAKRLFNPGDTTTLTPAQTHFADGLESAFNTALDTMKDDITQSLNGGVEVDISQRLSDCVVAAAAVASAACDLDLTPDQLDELDAIIKEMRADDQPDQPAVH